VYLKWPLLDWPALKKKHFGSYSNMCAYVGLSSSYKQKVLDCCINKCSVYYKTRSGLDTCPEPGCGEPRFDEDGKTPRCVFLYYSIKDVLMELLGNANVAPYFG
jgi:hypothetical protein